MAKKPVLNKKDFVRRYAQSEFGNASPTWDTFEQWVDRRVGVGNLFHVRNRIAGGQTYYNVTCEKMWSVWHLAAVKYGIENFYISAMCPTEKTVIQGEVQRGIWGLDLYYTMIAKPMREALAIEARQTCGIIANVLLKTCLCQRSHEWLMYLLDEYPDHVVEFTTLSVEWGTVPGYNTLFWEVRAY